MITHGIVESAKADFLRGIHRPDHQYKLALYTSDAALGQFTNAYRLLGEVEGEGYQAGGKELRGFDTGTGQDGSGWLTWTDAVVWPVATIKARGALIYNNSLPGKPALCVLDFGQEFKSVNGAFTVALPPALIVLE